VRANRVLSSYPIVTSDVLATVVDILNVSAPHALDGISLLPVLRGEQTDRPLEAGIGIHGSFPYGDTNRPVQRCPKTDAASRLGDVPADFSTSGRGTGQFSWAEGNHMKVNISSPHANHSQTWSNFTSFSYMYVFLPPWADIWVRGDLQWQEQFVSRPGDRDPALGKSWLALLLVQSIHRSRRDARSVGSKAAACATDVQALSAMAVGGAREPRGARAGVQHGRRPPRTEGGALQNHLRGSVTAITLAARYEIRVPTCNVDRHLHNTQNSSHPLSDYVVSGPATQNHTG
jgi:hypothetical protein